MLSSPTPAQLARESWIFYSIGVVVIFGRMYSRKLVLGSWKRFQIEDYLMLADLAFYTILMVAINVSAQHATNLLLPGEYETLTQDDIKDRIYGSKVVILLEQAMLICTWLTKACMLLLYHRLASRLPHQFVIKCIAVYVAFGFVAVELAWFLSCRPLYGYWMLPVPHSQCATYQHYSIVQAVFNISSDIMMLMVGIPLLLKAKVQLKKKILLVGIFSLGIFVVLAAVLNKYFNFSNPLTTIYMLWYIRESSVAIYVSNTPMLWPLARKVFNAGSFAGSSGGGGYGQTGSKGSKGSGAELSKIRRASRAKQEDIESSPGSTNDSTEQINKMQISTRLSFTIEDARHSPINPNGYDVERNGDSSYKASVISGGNHVPSKS